ncbi:hypothetical protein [Radiobacillus deserti]|uniref:Uncharacterized protein n=1 Tax=Radiobacillus deserti TaxID=2594883 RepID=A0A516KFU3_9BACI|nr:hypothetical protein [Radiobacillus deserti]QDP40275.1 hypothetical protein FN924_08870 [Radiobacillus deserti]
MLIGSIIFTIFIIAVIGFVYYGWRKNVGKTVFVVAITTALIGGGLFWYFTQTASGQRAVKSLDSNVSGGLERTVEVYDYNGKLVEKYEGKIDIREQDVSGKVLFDMNGKRHIINGGIVIIEEK